MKPPPQPEAAPDNPFEVFDCCAALMAYLYKRHGARAVQGVLDEFLRDGATDREWFEAQAARLRSLGLQGVAKVVTEEASKAPPLAAIAAEDGADGKARIARHYRNGDFGPASIEYLQQHADPGVLEFMHRAKGPIRRRKP